MKTVLTSLALSCGIILAAALYYRRYKKLKEKLYKEFGFVDLPLMTNIHPLSQLCFFKNTTVPRFTRQTQIDFNQNFEIRNEDVFIASFPKSGTTWTQEIVWLILNNLDFDTAKKVSLTTRSPFVEMGIPVQLSDVAKMKSPRCLKTHLSYEALPPKVLDKSSKIICVIRNPKDVVVSYYYHYKSGTMKLFHGEFPEFWDMFINNKVYGAPFWDHILGYWKKQNQKNILIIKYEDMQKDLKANIKKIGIFLGKTLSAQQLEEIADHCTFKKMKDNPTIKIKIFKFIKGPNLVRKGIVGDWKNHFTVKMNEEMDKWCEKHLAGTGLTFDYD